MPEKVEKHYPLKMQAFADTMRALSIATPDSIVRGSIMMLSDGIHGRYRLETPTKINKVTEIDGVIMEDASTFIKKIGLADMFGLEESHPCFAFFKGCVAENILSLFKKGHPMGYQIGEALGKVEVDKPMIDDVFTRQRKQNENFLESNYGSTCGEQAADIRLLVIDLFSFLVRRCWSEEEDAAFLVTKKEVSEWIDGWKHWGLPVARSPLKNRRCILFERPSRRPKGNNH